MPSLVPPAGFEVIGRNWLVLTCIIAGGFIVSRPVYAIDCPQAKDSISAAICGNAELKEQDDHLATAYRQTYSLLDHEKQSVFLAEQRAWLKRRDEICKSGGDSALVSCVRDSVDRRIGQILVWRETNTTRLRNGSTIRIGGAILNVEGRQSDYFARLVYNGDVVAEAAAYQGFGIDGRWRGNGREAIVLAAGDGGTLECENLSVVEIGAENRLRSIPIAADSCSDRIFQTQTVKEGFVVKREPLPTENGAMIFWDGRTDTVTKKVLKFAPRPHTRMGDLSKIADEDAFLNQEPLENEEFYNAVLKETGSDSRRFLRALTHLSYLNWAASNKASDAGAENDADFIIYQGCGQIAELSLESCSEDVALAIWEKKTGKFFFAVKKRQGTSGTQNLDVYPMKSKWPSAVEEILASRLGQ